MTQPSELTALLNKVVAGDADAEGVLAPQIYQELKKRAAGYLRHERAGHTLQATALVHEAYVKLIHDTPMEWQSRAHFFAMASRVMRRILVDHARRKKADKRGGSSFPEILDQNAIISDDHFETIMAVHQALDRLERLDPRQARIVEMRFFGGMTEDEIGCFFGISPRTVKRDWKMARAWLYGELSQ